MQCLLRNYDMTHQTRGLYRHVTGASQGQMSTGQEESNGLDPKVQENMLVSRVLVISE